MAGGGFSRAGRPGGSSSVNAVYKFVNRLDLARLPCTRQPGLVVALMCCSLFKRASRIKRMLLALTSTTTALAGHSNVSYLRNPQPHQLQAFIQLRTGGFPTL
jgi:hypothetical protein